MRSLDYAASVPINIAAPFVTVDTSIPGERFKDFIPAKPIVARVAPKDQLRIRKPPIVRGVDFVSHEETAKRDIGERHSIMKLAKDVWQGQSKRRQDFETARKLVDNSTAEQIAKPNPQLERALKVIKRPPMSKEMCVEQATKQFYAGITEQ